MSANAPNDLPDEVVQPRQSGRSRRTETGQDIVPGAEVISKGNRKTTPPPSAPKTPNVKRNTRSGGTLNDPLVTAPLAQAATAQGELGMTGLNVSAGLIHERRDHRFVGRWWREQLEAMMDNSAIIGAINDSISTRFRQTEWKVIPASDKPQDKGDADLIRTAMDDMAQPWGQFLAEASTMVGYGWSYFETSYKRRLGLNPPKRQGADRQPSRYDDGKFGWHKIAPRAQSSLLRWVIDQHGGIHGLIQQTLLQQTPVFLPIERCLLFRPTAYRNNPEGRSIYTNAWQSWFYMERMMQAEAIGNERDLAGYPHMQVPMRIMLQDADPAEQQLFLDLKALMQGIYRNENEGLISPQMYDAKGNPLFKFELIRSGGARQSDVRRIITDYKLDIALAALADFLLVGHTDTGAFNLADAKDLTFTLALKTYMEAILDVLNQFAIPRLLRMNGRRPKVMPQLAIGKVRPFDLNELGTFIQRLAAAGMDLFPSRTIEDALYGAANLPIPSDADRPQPGQGNLSKRGGNANQQANDAPPGGQAPNPARQRTKNQSRPANSPAKSSS